MKRINVPLLNSLNQADAQTASFILCADTNRHLINSVNWAGRFPYCPDSKFCIARSDNSLYVRFQILEDNLRALYLIDQEPVWEDSCVEFFCKKPQSDNYMNFEFNCIGTCVATTRKGRDVDVIPFSKN